MTTIQTSDSTRQNRPLFKPPVDVYENDDELLVVASLPGASGDAVDVTLEGRDLLIAARTSDLPEGRVLRAEYRGADYERRLALGVDVNPDAIGASFERGVLTVHLPKAKAARKTVKVSLSAN